MTTQKQTSGKIYPWIVVALLWVVALLNYLDRQMLSTMADSMKVDIAELQDPKYFGYLMAVFLWIYGLMSPLAGAIADRISRKWLIVGSLLVWSAVTLLMGMSSSYNTIFILRAIMGISEALYIPAGLALITEYHTGRTRSLAVGIHMTGLYMGQALGGFGATVAHHFSWQTTFISFGLAGVIYAVVLALALKDKKNAMGLDQSSSVVKPNAIPFGQGLKKLFGNVAFWVILIYFAAPSLPGWATKNWLPTLFRDSLGIDMQHAGPLSTISIAFSSFVGVIIGGMLSDRWVQRNLRGRVYIGAIGLALTIPALIFLGLGHGMVTIIGAALCFGVGFGMFDANNMPILCQFVPDNLRSTAYGFMNMVGVFSGALITQVLGAWTGEGNLGLGFAMLAGIVLVALLLQITILRPKYVDMKSENF
ncbi:MAG: MFS transporter [Porphyromonas sp.]|nr:MFS transporter [Porphyromonas sp.]